MGRKRGKRGRGEGTIYQRPDGTWAGQITVAYDPITKKQDRRTVYGATQAEVREKLDQAKKEAQEASGAVLGAQKVKDALDFWFTNQKNKIREASIVKYEKAIERLNHYLGHLSLAALDADAVAKMYKQMMADEVPTSSARYAAGRLYQAVCMTIEKCSAVPTEKCSARVHDSRLPTQVTRALETETG